MFPRISILAISEMLLRNVDSQNEEELKQLSTVYGSGYEILGIIDGISRLSNLQDGTIDLVEKEYAVSDVIEELAIQFKEMINRELVSIKVSIEDDIPNGLIGDCSKIKEILLNLYQRAAKTTKEGSISISVDWRTIPPEECEKEDSIYLDIEISDTGTGVKEERLDSFFDLDDSYDRTDIGNFDVSIGLAIARQLIESMGGTPEVDSTYGAGTTIRFSIIQQVFDYSYVNYNVSKRKELAFRNSSSRIWLPDVRILLVDDSDVSLGIQKVIFESYGVTITLSIASKPDNAVSQTNSYDSNITFWIPRLTSESSTRSIRTSGSQILFVRSEAWMEKSIREFRLLRFQRIM